MRDRGNLIVRIQNAPVLRRVLRRRAGAGPPTDPTHAPGHRHREPPPDQATPDLSDTEPGRNQPWIRTSHSDSQQRRFRR